jgi:hypothetical protein
MTASRPALSFKKKGGGTWVKDKNQKLIFLPLKGYIWLLIKKRFYSKK